MSNSLRPHGWQHARLPCPSPTPGACSNSCPLSQRCHPTISSSVIPFFSCLQSFQHQGVFQWVSSSHWVAKVLQLQLQHQSFQWTVRTALWLTWWIDWFIDFMIDWLDLREVQGTLKSLLQHHSPEASILWCLAFFTVQLSHPYMTTGKTIALTGRTFVGKVMSLLLNMQSRLVIPSFQEQASFNFMAAITTCSDFGAKKNKVWHCFHHLPIYFLWSDGTRCHDLNLLNVEL